jgi:hypothetical protein
MAIAGQLFYTYPCICDRKLQPRVLWHSSCGFFRQYYMKANNTFCYVRFQVLTAVWCSELSSVHHQGWVRQHTPLKRLSTIILHGSTSQKTILDLLSTLQNSCLRIFIVYYSWITDTRQTCFRTLSRSFVFSSSTVQPAVLAYDRSLKVSDDRTFLCVKLFFLTSLIVRIIKLWTYNVSEAVLYFHLEGESSRE